MAKSTCASIFGKHAHGCGVRIPIRGIDIYVGERGRLRYLPVQSCHACCRRVLNVYDEVANLSIEVGLVDVPLIAVVVGNVHI